MLLNFLKITWRRLWRNRLYAFLNIAGLSLGLAVSFLIVLYILDELQYNRIYPKQDRVYRAYAKTQEGQIWPSPAYAVGPHLKTHYAEVEGACRFFSFDDILVSLEGKRYREDLFGLADPDIFHIFDKKIIAGKGENVLQDPDALVISQSTAKRFFGEKSPLGAVFTIYNDTFAYNFTVRAVMEDAPDNSLYPFHFIIPFTSGKKIGYSELEGWDRYGAPTYVLLSEGSDYSAFAAKAEGAFRRHAHNSSNQLLFQPLDEVYLYNLEESGGRIEYVWIFGMVAFFLLLIACINFMNLATAQSLQRAQEVGIRKTVGATRSDLIRQFFGESMLMTLLSGILALSLIQLFLPVFNQLADKSLSWDTFAWYHWLAFGLIVLFTGILAGSYPALLLSSFRPMAVLKGRFSPGIGQRRLRQALVVIQFSLSLILIMGMLVVEDQLQYIQQKQLGFEREQVIFIENIGDLMSQYEALEEKLAQSPHIIAITAVSALPTHIFSYGGTPDFPGKPADFQTNFLFSLVDHHYLKTFQMEMAAGRFYTFEEANDELRPFVINETAARLMGLENPVGSRMGYWGREGQIIGVVKDFHTHGMLEPIKPLILMLSHQWINQVAIRLSGSDLQSGIAFIRESWEALYPQIPFEYHFLDEEFAMQYRDEQQTAALFKYLAYLAIFISCLGLFGLAAFTVERRSKEIGLRKVLGANVGDILRILLWQFTRPVLLAIGLAAPAAWYLMHQWLTGFEYHIQPGLRMVFWAAGIALLIAWLTVGYQSLRASLTNPAEVLRNE